jgi:outer membrane protein assembly factor BamE (lipoprotein component of BamABCDE complex)
MIAAAVLLGGCATYQQGTPWWTLHADSFAPVTAGTSKDDVARLLGKPLMSTTYRNLGEDVWDYRFLGGTRVYVAEIHFDQDGRTKYYTTYLDRCVTGPMGCR